MLVSRAPLAILVVAASACTTARVISTPMPTPQAGSTIRYSTEPDSGGLTPAQVISLDADRLVAVRLLPDARGRRVVDTVPSASVSMLQVRVGRTSNSTSGLAIGGLVGLGLGVACASGDNDWVVSDQGCVAGYTVLGAGLGFLIGAVTHRDVWAPAAMPALPLPPVPAPVSVAPVVLQVPIPIRESGR